MPPLGGRLGARQQVQRLLLHAARAGGCVPASAAAQALAGSEAQGGGGGATHPRTPPHPPVRSACHAARHPRPGCGSRSARHGWGVHPWLRPAACGHGAGGLMLHRSAGRRGPPKHAAWVAKRSCTRQTRTAATHGAALDAARAAAAWLLMLALATDATARPAGFGPSSRARRRTLSWSAAPPPSISSRSSNCSLIRRRQGEGGGGGRSERREARRARLQPGAGPSPCSPGLARGCTGAASAGPPSNTASRPLASAEMPMDSATALITSLLTSVSSAKRDRAPLDSSSEKLRGQGQRGRA